MSQNSMKENHSRKLGSVEIQHTLTHWLPEERRLIAAKAVSERANV